MTYMYFLIKFSTCSLLIELVDLCPTEPGITTGCSTYLSKTQLPQLSIVGIPGAAADRLQSSHDAKVSGFHNDDHESTAQSLHVFIKGSITAN